MAEIFVASAGPKKKMHLDNILRRLLWGVIVFLIVFSLVELGYYLLVSPHVLITKIECEGDLKLSEQEILSLAGLSGNEYYFTINLKAVEEGIKQHPMVREVIVEKIFPNTLRLTLMGRKPLLLVQLAEGKSLGYGYLDEEGVVFAKANHIGELNLPIISGLRSNLRQVAARLPSSYLPFLQDLSELKREHPNLFNLLSEIRVVNTDNGGYELVIYPQIFRLRVWIGRRVKAGSLRYLFFTLNFLDQQGKLKNITEADFRTGELVYTMKGED